METYVCYLLPLLLLPLSLYIIFFIRNKPSHELKNLPPGSYGWPILGENLVYAISGAQQLVRDRMQKYSPEVFKTKLFGEKMAVLCGAEGNKLIFKNDNKLFTTWLPPSLRKALYPKSADVASTNKAKLLFPKFQYDALKPETLKQYIPVIDALAREHLDHEWRPNSVVKALPLIKKYTFELAWRLFMGVVDVERVEKLLEPFDLMTDGMVSVDIDLPGTAFRGAVEGSRILRGELMKMIEERRKEAAVGRDLLSRMVESTDEDGKHLSDDSIANFMIGLLVASHYEISAAITVVLSFLAQLPHIYDGVLKEQMEIARSRSPGDEVRWEDIGKMKYLWNVVCESFRLVPPSIGSFREATAEITCAGFTIPKGWKVMWSPHSCHESPDYFPEPEKFDPSRFEGSGPAPYTYVPFGGGTRICPGREYAKLVIMVFIHNVVMRFRFEKLIPIEKMLFHVTPKPEHGLPLRLHPHQNYI